MPEMAVTVVKQGSKVCLAEAWFFLFIWQEKCINMCLRVELCSESRRVSSCHG
jgi:hypothetical protein